MKEPYDDITKVMGEPRWWDSHGVPRYSTFRPDDANDIYSDYVALVLVQCQSCRKKMKVAIKCRQREVVFPTPADIGTIRLYGDPPAHINHMGKYCHAGCAMDSEHKKILQFWHRNEDSDWIRLRKHEVKFTEAFPVDFTPPAKPAHDSKAAIQQRCKEIADQVIDLFKNDSISHEVRMKYATEGFNEYKTLVKKAELQGWDWPSSISEQTMSSILISFKIAYGLARILTTR